MATRFSAYAKDALVPALGRAGIAPVGAWNVSLGADSPTLHLLVPHKDAESVVSLDARLAADAEYAKAAASFLALPPADPPYERCDSSLIRAVPTQPGIDKPNGAAPARVYELRTYHSPSEPAGRKKVEMFEAGGELAIFRRLGLPVVFFGRDLVGSGLPCLTYMLAFADAGAREKAWIAFRDDPGVAQAARPAAERRHRLRDRRERAARDRLLADLILSKGACAGPPWTPARSARMDRATLAARCLYAWDLHTSPPGNSWAASEASFISAE